MLVGDVEIGFCYFFWQQQSIVLHAAVFPQLFIAFRPKHFAEGVRCIHRTINKYVNDVDSFG